MVADLLLRTGERLCDFCIAAVLGVRVNDVLNATLVLSEAPEFHTTVGRCDLCALETTVVGARRAS